MSLSIFEVAFVAVAIADLESAHALLFAFVPLASVEASALIPHSAFLQVAFHPRIFISTLGYR